MASIPTHQEIQQLAHQLWIERGRPQGTPEIDWEQAEGLLRMSRTASSPPAQPAEARTADVPIRVPTAQPSAAAANRAKANGSMPPRGARAERSTTR